MSSTYYNTTNLSGTELKEAVAKAAKQELSIFLIFLHTRKPFTASEITRLTEKAGKQWPLWSNRRAITNLKTDKELVMLSEKKMGPMGKPEHLYQINFLKYPSLTGEQTKLFAA